MADINEILRRWKKLKAEKSEWHQHYDDLARIFLPRRLGFATTRVVGERRTQALYDSTPMQAARGLANAIGGMMRPEGLPEVEMLTDNDALNNSEEVKAWLADSAALGANRGSSAAKPERVRKRASAARGWPRRERDGSMGLNIRRVVCATT